MWLFTREDKRIECITSDSSDVPTKYVEKEYIAEYDIENPLEIVEYRCSAYQARDRLDLKGFTLDIAKHCFLKGLAYEIDSIYSRQAMMRQHTSNIEVLTKFWNDQLAVLESLTADKWLNALRRIWNEKLNRESIALLAPNDQDLSLLEYMVNDRDGQYGFPGLYFWGFLRLILEVVPPTELLVYDLTDLVLGSYVDKDADLLLSVSRQMQLDIDLNDQTIVLTEGITDKDILSRSLNLLCPHLKEYFHFFEFTGNGNHRSGGGAGELANLVRAFASSKIQHRIIAIFDNDTAARAAVSTLNVKELPSNIVVRHYPTIELGREYPTKGPTGDHTMDVNGLAGSIELYLGRDVLCDSDGNLTPVQWKGNDNRLKDYQGEIIGKNEAVKKFRSKLSVYEANPSSIDLYDWADIRSIIEVLLTAFHKVDSDNIIEGLYDFG